MSSVEDWNIDALAAEAPQLHGPFMYKDEPLSVEIREDFPHLRPMEYDALKSIYSNPTYGEPVVAYLLQQEEDVQRHILLNYVYVQTQEQRQRMQEERQSAQNSLGELTLRLNQVEAALASKPKGRNDSSDVLKLRVLPYSGRERESLRRWFVELETAMVARKIYAEDRKVAFALSSLAGPARAWGYNSFLLIRISFLLMKLLRKSYLRNLNLLARFNVPFLSCWISLRGNELFMSISNI